jgi:DNA-binding phage protein
MVKKKTLSKRRKSLEKSKKLDLSKVKGVSRANPLEQLTDPKSTALAILECLQNNDPEGVMEMIAIYLNALNKAKLRKRTELPKSTLYSTLQHRNPTIKTLAKIMYTSTH